MYPRCLIIIVNKLPPCCRICLRLQVNFLWVGKTIIYGDLHAPGTCYMYMHVLCKMFILYASPGRASLIAGAYPGLASAYECLVWDIRLINHRELPLLSTVLVEACLRIASSQYFHYLTFLDYTISYITSGKLPIWIWTRRKHLDLI